MKKLIEMLESIRFLFVSNHVVSAEYKDGVMTVKYERGQEQYEGSCTVWHKLPYMERCGTSTEAWLCDLWEYNKKWSGAYPDAHKSKFNHLHTSWSEIWMDWLKSEQHKTDVNFSLWLQNNYEVPNKIIK